MVARALPGRRSMVRDSLVISPADVKIASIVFVSCGRLKIHVKDSCKYVLDAGFALVHSAKPAGRSGVPAGHPERKPTTSRRSRMASTEKMVRAPEGYARIGAVADVPYFLLEKGNVAHGTLLGVYTRDDKRAASGKTKFFQIELLAPCKVREGRGEDVEVRTAEVGEIVNLNYNPKTKELEPLCREILGGAAYEVFAPCLGKMNLQNGNTMWNFDVSVNQVRKARAEEPDFGDGVAEAAGE